ncbi:undecaprenyl-phosphate beta-glucosephosphotransferase [Ligilactobacillus araffinosus DSM 20653]|uniref:Undecaprenyl-phosphate beta-glucosephosphotransferase n=1 Tax=Ligilactobacillus araffinosus DSM 20653 TaxID=1423820 RepID=A0A0R1ZE64_9LACO|nr:undecaprenyl-phosphate beta-glucosephosphotransferase [Ligilactobacillus araffinosus DSM 20653]
MIGLIILSPVFLIVAIAIKLDDGGPVFYDQIRVGRNGKKFKMFKFRSMRVNAEDEIEKLQKHSEVDGAMFKMRNDPRVTRVGKFIRKTSIDEFPQLINVLIGQMSVVGPRPPLPREVKNYTEYDKQRLYVKPGCTGLWQVTARNSVGFQEMVNIDLDYIQNRSIWLDLKIIFKTIKVIFVPNEAY